MLSFVRPGLCVTLALALACPTVAMARTVDDEELPDPSTLSDDEKLEWAKKLYLQAKEYHDNEDFYNSVIKYEQAYSYAPDKHIFAYNLGVDAWELRDCARVKQYLQLFIIKDEDNPDLVSDAKEILKKADNNPECVTGGGSSTAPADDPTEPAVTSTAGPVEDPDEPILEAKPREDVDAGPGKKGPSPLLIGGAVLTALGAGAAAGGIVTLILAKGKAEDLTAMAKPSEEPGKPMFAQQQYNDDVKKAEKQLNTFNILTPTLLIAGGALLATGVALIVVDVGNKKKGKGHYASDKKVELAGMGAAPMPGGGAAASLSLRF